MSTLNCRVLSEARRQYFATEASSRAPETENETAEFSVFQSMRIAVQRNVKSTLACVIRLAASYNFSTETISGNSATTDIGSARSNYGSNILTPMGCFDYQESHKKQQIRILCAISLRRGKIVNGG